jgi:hypothetical protein
MMKVEQIVNETQTTETTLAMEITTTAVVAVTISTENISVMMRVQIIKQINNILNLKENVSALQ